VIVMRVFVAGVLGRRLVPTLVARGHQATATTTSAAKLELLWDLGADGINIVDDEPAPASEWLPYLAACAGAKPPMRIPAWVARLLAGDTVVTMMTEGRGFSNAKAKRELGWQLRYPSWRQGFQEAMA
jgi:nucleoside-diphosphate-sugar epimerase